MANGRFLSSSIAYDSRLNSLSLEAEYIYLKAIPHLDRDGLIQGDPALLFATVCPRRVDMISRIEDVINEWIALELVTRYDGWQEGAVLFFHGFKRNQTGLRYEREKPSQFAAPPGYIRTEQGLRMVQEDVETEAPSADPDDVRHYSGSAPAPVGSNTREKCEVGSVK